MLDYESLNMTLLNARQALLAERLEHGHWEGELSSSPLSTATAILTLHLYCQSATRSDRTEALERLIDRGAAWLSSHQNSDGGWGDTTKSLSNISTTALVWGALAAVDIDGVHRSAIETARAWLSREAGGVHPDQLVPAILRRYGNDRTFSVPILTHLALAGRLGPAPACWRLVPQLPFELAACPHQWFKTLRLPVVSYALPALIAMGQVRHTQWPTRNPITRLLRNRVRGKTLRVLREIQPGSGGYLEATPLTSFVCMSLIGAGQHDHPVVQSGIKFMVDSVRADGSWPIDTNLATWVTTLSVNALWASDPEVCLSRDERQQIASWLFDQQHCVEHPYTHAAPGGWAWTDLSGGVPDADDTPGALLALAHLTPEDPRARKAATHGIGWLLDLQNRDGGMPTFCRGWGLLPFDRSSADLTAHALRAFVAWRDAMDQPLQARIERGIRHGLGYLLQTQHASGAWAPLWFGNQYSPDETNLVYGTSRVLRMIADLPPEFITRALDEAVLHATTWLRSCQNFDGGWGGSESTPSSIEETALAVEALAALASRRSRCDVSSERLSQPQDLARSIAAGVEWLVRHTDQGRAFPPSPIGFYFAKLWYFERLYPLIFTVAALGQVQRLMRQINLETDAVGMQAG